MDKSTHIPGAKEYKATPVPVKDMMVQDRKTGEWYNVQERFDQLMNRAEVQATLQRLKVR